LKSKKRSRITIGRSQPEEPPPIFFLDRTFGKIKLAELLRVSGFLLVTHFEEYGDEGHKIGDQAIIHDCGRKNRVLVTGDQDLIHTYAREIREAKIAVFVTTDNQEGPAAWGPRIVAARSGMIRELTRRAKPFTAAISKEGRISHVRMYEHGHWKTTIIGKKHSPHVNRQKETEPSPAELQGSGFRLTEGQAGAETKV
jgi:predicted nuclease of predicted toxin-antitoxin system